MSRLQDALPAAQAGEAWALRVVFDELGPAVHAYVRRRGSCEPDDLTSEVFFAVLPRLASVTGGAGGLRTLVFSVAHARLVDELRRRARRAPTVELEQHHGRWSSSAEDEMLVAQGDERVRALLAGLPQDQRDVLLLRIVADLTVEQVATVIGRSAGAVKQLQRRGLLALRQRVATEGVTL